MELRLCICLFFGFIYLVSASGDPCETRDTCSKCITYPKCVWCPTAELGKKCTTDNSLIRRMCKDDLQVKESKVLPTEKENFISSTEKVVQLTPQRIKMDLRVGQPTSFDFKFKQARDYPVDLYFLLDASLSMERVRSALKTQSKKIYKVMEKFTKHIRLGMGTFVDKNAFPYVEYPEKKEVYSFRHHLNFTDKAEVFNSAIDGIRTVANFDSPEGGLDALAQVLACSEDSQNIIQWNKHSRKFVLLITDAQFHVAGDGLLAGIYQPYDGRCYTTPDGIYTNELKMDYPSVSMIYKLAKRIEAFLIFIVSDDIKNIYYDLSNYVEGIRKTYYIQDNSDIGADNFDDKLREAYEDKTKYIKLITTIRGKNSQDNLKIDFTPDCREGNEEKDACEIQEEKEIKITGTITLETYSEASNEFKVDIVVNGINEKLQLDVKVLTKCDCEDHVRKNAIECSGNGTLVCGLCKCDENWYGPKCMCDKPDENSDPSACINKDDDKVCSGNGKCECGACKCDSHGGEQPFNGAYCQCDANSCPIGSNGKQCSGHGACDCGQCMCYNNWIGTTCEISTLKTNCIKDSKECNGHGTCVNNNCECNKAPEWDARQTFDKLCGIMPETEQNQCKLLENHALCAYEKTISCPNKDSVKVSLTKDIAESEKKTMKICDDVRVGPGCYIQFGYKYNDGDRSVQLLVEEKANCQESYYMFGGIILGTLIFVGICTLVGWKVLTTRRDKKEYAAFLLASHRQTSIRKNVLYTSPQTTIDNPTYENKCE